MTDKQWKEIAKEANLIFRVEELDKIGFDFDKFLAFFKSKFQQREEELRESRKEVKKNDRI